MKKRILSTIIAVSLISMAVPEAVLAAGEAGLTDKLKNYTSDTVVKTYYDDFNNDGQYEMFAMTGMTSYDEMFEMSILGGKVWYVSDSEVKDLTENTGIGVIMSGEYQPSYVNTNKGKQFIYRNIWGNGQIQTSICTVVSGGGVKTTGFNGSLLYGDYGWYAASSAYDIMIDKADFDKGVLFGAGRSWKDYWYYFDDSADEFKEYGGTEITQEQLLKFSGAQDILNLITEGRIYNILYRDNGIININIMTEDNVSSMYTMSNILVGYNDDSVWAIEDQDMSRTDNAKINNGLYLAALNPSMAVYPQFKEPNSKKSYGAASEYKSVNEKTADNNAAGSKAGNNKTIKAFISGVMWFILFSRLPR